MDQLSFWDELLVTSGNLIDEIIQAENPRFFPIGSKADELKYEILWNKAKLDLLRNLKAQLQFEGRID